ncbi:MAG: hypothetical protein A3G34_06570 [Candidatus Lindowbacteria bacterium RIFCSPLOWO2_12_FULL_62_27]|nr:MAG: hypothetical protein A3G34_06570 [Candidatus Lindowbacteria bacterium RIFCSPLOWO2_12_FULL_62_27]OGH63047.1 MAG: hypothetical protein A3I06_16470 [Candidatus Lindowbacteria bacterium RIFCSPLOWO2_02_FULL_62_12]
MKNLWLVLFMTSVAAAVEPASAKTVSGIPESLSGYWFYWSDPDGTLRATDIQQRMAQGEKRKMLIPSNWSRHDRDLLNYNGVVWFARAFNAKKPRLTERLFLQFDGVDYEADVFLNGRPVGRHTGYFEPFRINITDTVQAGENLLIVRVNSPRDEGYADKKTLIKGIFVHHDCRPGSNSGQQNQNEPTGGIWGDVRLVRTGPVAVEGARIMTELKDGKGRITARYRLRNYSASTQYPRLNLSVAGKTFESTPVKGRANVKINPGAMEEAVVTLDVPDPRLWWTWDHGRPDLYRVVAQLVFEGVVTETREDAVGFRTIEFDEKALIMKLNGRPVFHRGSNYIATQWLAGYGREQFQKDIDLMKGANLNSIRVHAHVLPHTFYDLADESGVLVWADFALIWGYDPSESFARDALRQYRAFIDGWFHHPSIWLWCAHNEGSANDPLNIRLVEMARSLDPTRVHLKNSGKWPPGPGGWDEHEYAGWYGGNYLEFADKQHQFVTEYGAQAAPAGFEKILASGHRWPPDLDDWRYHDFQLTENLRNLGPLELFNSVADFVETSQKYQYDLLKFSTEAYRRTKYRPLGGIYHFMFTECWPAMTWAVVDHERAPKLGYHALRDAMAPVIVSLEVRRREVAPGETIDIPVWVVSDLDEPLKNWRVRFGVEGGEAQTSEVSLGADAAMQVAVLKVTAPETPGTSVRIFSELFDSESKIQNPKSKISMSEWGFVVKSDPFRLGHWTFRTGDDMAWAKGDAAPEGFKPIKVPGNWENDGYPDYDGYGWYRATFVVPPAHKGELQLMLGPVDDVDELYVNGEFVGRTGRFPPNYETAWTAERAYMIPEKLLRKDRPNVIAIRVYDSTGGGGPYKGPVKLIVPVGVDLASDRWRLKHGDDPAWSDPAFNDKDWKRVRVPQTWEGTLGEVDGFGWYRLKFDVPPSALPAGPLTLTIGAVDDVDATYLNGKKIGQTGEFPPSTGGGATWTTMRRYFLPRDLLRAKDNVLAVRVYDGGGGGGIWQGPVRIDAMDASLRYRPVRATYP